MDIISAREYCISLPHVEETFPFDESTLVLKVGGKMFALIALDADPCIALKCDPELAVSLRERFPAVLPGHHLSKKHWNTILLNDTIPDKTIEEWILHSYGLVISGLPKKIRESMQF
jgi:predicted DNA-binding protein (MmcQ/YjbR family)